LRCLGLGGSSYFQPEAVSLVMALKQWVNAVHIQYCSCRFIRETQFYTF
jgi:hypothetical protein